ncbi:hypothetical protein GCM10012286_34080 [Streptomyces lasiicapitis]|uniref:Uncharacterized protein n=1 Tax=Streptomyces lasiicapitis TaxID=1923961 RepID=A0ABQ2LZX9_9ACTN|nr:hypothetical protein GCM10012286_34080 [Streptomyces lasiicapitis]
MSTERPKARPSNLGSVRRYLLDHLQGFAVRAGGETGNGVRDASGAGVRGCSGNGSDGSPGRGGDNTGNPGAPTTPGPSAPQSDRECPNAGRGGDGGAGGGSTGGGRSGGAGSDGCIILTVR